MACASSLRADDEGPAPLPNAESPVPFVRAVPMQPDADEMVQLEPNGEHDNRVGAILAAHPDRDVLICLAGCGGGGPKIVSLRPHTVAVAAMTRDTAQARELRPSSGDMPVRSAPAKSNGPSALEVQPAVGDVICLAGCIGAPGEVVQQAVRLTWINQSANTELRAALRDLTDRLIAQEAEAAASKASTGAGGRHAWMSDDARRMLVEQPLPVALAALVRSATALAEKSPLRAP